uniref:Uncharacterized protein n=1 Tax=viral metagenome TaxID=1070528 RepID=A0A6H2A1N0_9ZZZZ
MAIEDGMTPEEINEVNEGLWKELDEVKEKSGYNEYWGHRQSSGGLTLIGWLVRLRVVYEKEKKEKR